MGPLLLAIPFVRCDDELVLYLMTYHSHCFVRPRSVFLWLSSTAACGDGSVAWNATGPSSELEASGNGTSKSLSRC